MTKDINLALLISDLDFLLGDRLGTVATAVANNIFRLAEECWMTMKINCAVFGLIPLGVQQQILGVK